jgi:DNA (cytosine-5)-methyltransferase 1
LNAVDLFAGAGGWSLGWEDATGGSPMVAVNHCAHAVHLHTLNHPSTRHFLEDVRAVDPKAACRGERVDWLHLSPDCTHFSRAKGSKPRDQGIRGLAWVGVDWARAVRPTVISLENVAEFLGWGPLDDEGRPVQSQVGATFAEFVAELRGIGYDVEWQVLRAADYGAPTSRRRLFLLARNDGLPIVWPKPTHRDPKSRSLFDQHLPPWRTAAECIDWTIPVASIFTRKKPLADATCRRIAAGVVRYMLEGKPFLVQIGYGEREGQAPRVLDIDKPLGTVVADGCKHALVAAFLAKHYTGVVGSSLRQPLGTVTAQDHHSLVAASLDGSRAKQVAAFLTSYYSAGGTASGMRQPVPTIVTKARHGLVTVTIAGEEHTLCDIGLRMLTPRELARAQGFPDSYRLDGTQTEQIARVGNSVVPQLAAALVRANAPRSHLG